MLKKNLPLIVALALPVVFIGILALVVLLPSARLNPRNDFVYVNYEEANSKGNRYVPVVYRNEYRVEGEKLVRVPLAAGANRGAADNSIAMPGSEVEYVDAPTLYHYSVTDDVTHEISFEDAQKLALTAGPSSPDGFIVKYEYNSDGIFELFGSDGGSGYVLIKGSARKSLPGMSNANDYYYGGFELIGWVK